MKGDMAQENRQVLDANADTVVNDLREPGLRPIAARLLKDGCTSSESFVARPHVSMSQLKRWRGAPKAKRLTSSNLPLAAWRRVAMPVPCCLRNAPNKLRAITALPLRHRYGRTSSPLPCGEASAAQ